jgi:hypothetical protein
MKGTALANVRKDQFFYHFRNLNFLYRIGLILLCFFVELLLKEIISNQKEGWVAVGLFVAILYQFQITRKDFRFIQININPSALNIQIEYLIFSTPLLLVLLIKLLIFQFMVLFGAACLIATFKYNRIVTYSHYASYFKINPQMFEWRSGIKKVFYFFILIYIFSLLLSPFRLVSILLLWFISNFISGFYISNESLQLLSVFGKDSHNLIRYKIVCALKYTYLIFIPVLMLYLFFNPHDIWFALLFFVNVTIYLIFVILFKYALYEPCKDFSGNQFILGIAQMSIIIPFLLPLPTILALRFYKRALLNLDQYL